MKMKRMILLAASCSIPLLSSCSSTTGGSMMSWAVEPVNSVSNDNPESHYQVGRYYQGQNRLDQAIQAYQKALAADPNFAEAHNGLGVIYSQQGKYAAAIEAFKSAAKLSPRAAHIRNNLGYAYYLQGLYAESVSVLKEAAALSPADPKILNNLGLAYARLGSHEESKLAFSQAINVAGSGLTDSRQQPGDAPPADSEQRSASTQPMPVQALALPKDRGVIGTPAASMVPLEGKPASIVQVAQSVYEVKETSPATAPATPASAPAPAPAPAPASASASASASAKMPAYRIEVSNGNGVNGMAKRLGKTLSAQGYPITRYTNQKPFVQKESNIEYRGGLIAAAQHLSETLPLKPLLSESKSLRGDIGVRLVLGKDMVGQDVAAGPGKKNLLAKNEPAPNAAN